MRNARSSVIANMGPAQIPHGGWDCTRACCSSSTRRQENSYGLNHLCLGSLRGSCDRRFTALLRRQWAFDCPNEAVPTAPIYFVRQSWEWYEKRSVFGRFHAGVDELGF